jgi:hypothetical protein
MTSADDTEPCCGCGKHLTEYEVAFRYAGGDPVCCSECKPTPEQLEAGRRDCAKAAVELWGHVEDVRAHWGVWLRG